MLDSCLLPPPDADDSKGSEWTSRCCLSASEQSFPFHLLPQGLWSKDKGSSDACWSQKLVMILLTANGSSSLSADENITIALCRKMNDVAGMKTTHASCECAEIPPARMHNNNDIQTVAIWNITSSNSKKNQVSEIMLSDAI